MDAFSADANQSTQSAHTRFPRYKLLGAAVVALMVSTAGTAAAAVGPGPVDLGAAAEYSVLGASTVTNTGPSVLSKDLGVSPGTAITGFPPGTTLGLVHSADANAAKAKFDASAAFTAAHSRTFTSTGQVDLGGLTLTPGTYDTGGVINLTGTLTLDAQGDPNAVFVLWSRSTLITASSSAVRLINEARPCNVVWLVDSSATLGTYTSFAGSVIALASVTVTTGVSVEGRAIALNGAVTLDSNRFNTSKCSAEFHAPEPTAAQDTAAQPDTDLSLGDWPSIFIAGTVAIVADVVAWFEQVRHTH